MIYAVIRDGVVVNRLVGEGDLPVIDGCVVVEAGHDDAHIGWGWNASLGNFIPPSSPEQFEDQVEATNEGI